MFKREGPVMRTRRLRRVVNAVAAIAASAVLLGVHGS